MSFTGITPDRFVRKTGKNLSLERILDRAVREEALSGEEILFLLGLSRGDEIGKLFRIARELRERYFGNRVFLYGFLYFSTWCRNHCNFCYYRSTNRACNRYRKTDAEIYEASLRLAQSGVHLLDFTMGEDPFYYGETDGFPALLDLTQRIKNDTGLSIMASWGVVPPAVLRRLRQAGVDWFACYQETHSRELFQTLRPNQDYDRRMQLKSDAWRLGLLIEEGVLSGVGESPLDIAHSLEFMRSLQFHQVRVMNFVPQEGTPMSPFPHPHPTRELIITAVLRLLLPHRLIPASLDVYGVDGLQGKLEAGANVVTSLIPPEAKLNGVAQSTLDISEGHRTVKGITPILHESGLQTAGREDYLSWMREARMQSRSGIES